MAAIRSSIGFYRVLEPQLCDCNLRVAVNESRSLSSSRARATPVVIVIPINIDKDFPIRALGDSNKLPRISYRQRSC